MEAEVKKEQSPKKQKDSWIYIAHVRYLDTNDKYYDIYNKFILDNEEEINNIVPRICMAIRQKPGFSKFASISYYQATIETTFEIDNINAFLDKSQRKMDFERAKKMYLKLKEEFEQEGAENPLTE